MAGLDRNTGLPYSATNNAANQSALLTGKQTTGPRTDTQQSTAKERAQSTVNSYQSALNTTPTALSALDAVIGQLLGTPAQEAVNEQQALLRVPDLQKVVKPSYISASGGGFDFGQKSPAYVYYVDPQTGKTYSEQQGATMNAQRAAERQKLVKQGAVAAKPGGTPEMQQQQAQRQQEISRNRAAQETYSKEAAFGDAQSLVNKAINDALEAALPQISRASEGAGTSRSSMGALLTQQAATKGGIEGAALGAQLGVQYGGIQNQLANTLELLTRSDPNSPTALLLQAILGSKGLVSEQSGQQTQDSTSTKNVNATTNQGPQDVFSQQLRQILDPLQGSLNSTLATAQGAPEAVQAQTTTKAPVFSSISRGPSDADTSSSVVTSTDLSVY